MYSIEKVTTLIGARRIGDTPASIKWLLTDSRSLAFPEETLFFAIKTDKGDGHLYIDDLYRRGVRNFVVSSVPDGSAVGISGSSAAFPACNFLKVTDTKAALQRLAERHRDEFDIPIVGITGSNGKTMVKEWLYQLLSPSMTVTRSPRSYNSQTGVPLSVWHLDEKSEVGIFEAGISKPGEMEALREIIQPTIGLLTCLGPAHQENFRSMEEKCDEKALLFKDAATVVYDSDNDVIGRSIRKAAPNAERITWSRQNAAASIYINKVERDGTGTTVEYTNNIGNEAAWRGGGETASYRIPFLSDAALECSFACVATALKLGLSAVDVAERMARLEPVAMRLEVKEGRKGCSIINDSYNSDINSLDIALDFMARRPESKVHRTLILSDIQQSGMPPMELYSAVSEMASSRGIDKFIGIGEQLRENVQYINIRFKAFFNTVEDFLRSDTFARIEDETILLKGARRFRFDRITEALEQKVHETILEVNLNAVVDNLNRYRSLMRPDCKLVCMVKADAYGAGAVEIAKILQDQRVDYLAVAVADEGVALRKSGITSNIIVMNPEMTAFKTIFDYKLEPEVYSFRLLDAMVAAAKKEGITNYPVHIKLDTGMCRLGFNPAEDMDELVSRLKRQTALIPRSVFSHFVGADSDDFNEFSSDQFAIFDAASRKLQGAYDHKILRHICNSAGIAHFPERQLDICRLGIGLYGVDPMANRMLSTVSTLKTTILQKRAVSKGATVGYSRRTTLDRDSVIASVPIGYADGLNRHLGNGRGYCLVNGKPARYVGNICMDVAMIDVTGIDCQEGDMVEIFGENLPVTQLSEWLETIPYEILTNVSNRVKKVYFNE